MSPHERVSAVLDEPETLSGFWEPSSLESYRAYPNVTFQILEATSSERKRWWSSFGVGTAIEILAVALLIILSAVLPSAVKIPSEHPHYVMVSITIPTLPRARAVAPPRQVIERPKPLEIPKQQIQAPVFRPELPSKVAMAKPAPKPVFLAPKVKVPAARMEPFHPTVPKWKPKVALGGFSNSVAATTHLPARKVQTGGFGNPNGLPGEALGGSRGNVPKLGTFNSPEGPGHGNGSGGSKGAPGLVASAGFGDAGVRPGTRTGSSSGAVQSGGFGDAGVRSGTSAGSGTVQSGGFGDAAVRSHTSQPQPQSMASSFEPVEIISKPNPVYTEEARKLHIQGEVVLNVVFTSSGEVRILQIVRGLGHGLDQAAIDDAREIRFTPARRGGVPVDTRAVLRIIFQLAD